MMTTKPITTRRTARTAARRYAENDLYETIRDAGRDAVEGDRTPHEPFEPEHEHGRRPHHSSNPAITAAHRTGSTSTTGGTARTTPTVNAKVASITTAACPAVRHVQTPTQREQHAPGW
jgi:hypothetical protein